jgi:hypothetical protein
VKKVLSYTLSAFVGSFIAALWGLNPLFGIALMLVGRICLQTLSTIPHGVLANAIDISALSDYAEENQRDLISTLVNGLDIANDIMVQPNVKNSIKLPKLTVGDGFRPFSSTPEFKANQLVFTERELITRTGKRELLIDFRKFKNTYLAWRTKAGNGANKKFDDYTFARFVWEKVIAGLQREINDETAYFGFDSSATPTYSEAATYPANSYIKFAVDGVTEYFKNISGGTTTAGQDPLDTPAKWRNVTARAVAPGIESIIVSAISGGFPVTATGAIGDGPSAHLAFKKMFRDMPAPYQNQGVIVHASFTDGNFLLDGIETNLSKYTTPEVSDLIKSGLIPIPGTDYKGWVKRATWMSGSRRLIAEPLAPGGTHGENLYMGTDLLSDANEIKTKENLWTLESGICVDLGFQIADLNALRVGDQQ